MKELTKEVIKPSVGCSVVLNREMKALEKGSIGVITEIHKDWCVIVYPQNLGTNKVYAHSAMLTEIL